MLAPSLADYEVAFVGDHDGLGVLLALLSKSGDFPHPARITILDFDERLLSSFRSLAQQHRLGKMIETRLWNAFDPLPTDLAGSFDAFYTNPPYGSRNDGGSIRLFIGRGMELVRPVSDAFGYVIAPYDKQRSWTQQGMLATQQFALSQGWNVGEMGGGMHAYALDEDPLLLSGTIRLDATGFSPAAQNALPFRNRLVGFDEVEHCYGHSVAPPYPRYILADGTVEHWPPNSLNPFNTRPA